MNVSIEDSFLGPFRAKLLTRKVENSYITVRVTSRNHTHYKCGEILTLHVDRVWLNHRYRKFRVLYIGKPELIR